MPVYSCRAECEHDVREFSRALLQKDSAAMVQCSILHLSIRGKPVDYGDRQCEIITQLDLEGVRDVLRGIEDTHIMLQSLRPVPLAENSLDRDYTID